VLCENISVFDELDSGYCPHNHDNLNKLLLSKVIYKYIERVS